MSAFKPDLLSATSKLTSLCSDAVEEHKVLGNEHLLELILSLLQNDHGSLNNVIRTCKFLRHVGEPLLWQAADLKHLTTHVSTAKRQQDLASMIKKVEFANCEAAWPSAVHDCPQFAKVNSLHIYNTSMSVNAPEQLKPFLNKSLRELLIHTDSDPNSHHRRDTLLLSQLSTVCFNLSSLKLEVALNVSSADMTSFFTSMSQLRTLWLGSELNSALGNDALTAIFTMSRLNHLFLDQSLESSFWKELPTVSKEILSRATKLQIKFPTSEGLVVGELLSMISTLKELVVTVVPTTGQRTTMLQPAFLQWISIIPELRTLTVCVSSQIPLTISVLSAVASMKNLTFFNLLSTERNYHPKPATLSLTAEDMIRVPIDFRFLQMLDVVDIQSPIVATYTQAVEIVQGIDNVSASYMCLFDLSVDEGESFGWPSASDYEAVMENTTPEYSI